MIPRYDRRLLLRYLAAAAVMVAGWFVLAEAVLPGLITSAYDQASIPVFNQVITNQNYEPLSYYLDRFEAARGMATIALLGVLGLMIVTAPVHGTLLRTLGRFLKTPPTTGIVTLACLGGTVGWIGGLLEAVWAHYRHADLPYGPSLEQYWLAPLAGALTIPALLVVFRGLTGRSAVSLGVASAVATTLVVYSMFRDSLLGIHPAAIVVLGIGLGAQVATLATRKPTATARLVRRALPALVGLSVVTGVAMSALERRSERDVIASLRSPPAGAPNVILLVIDTQNASRMSLYENNRSTTPNLERFAEGAVVFDMGLATTSWTLPSHMSMLSGKWPSELETHFTTRVDEAPEMLSEVLREAGYVTAGFIGNWGYIAARSRLNRGFARYMDESVTIEAWAESHWLTYRIVRLAQKTLGIHRRVRKRAEAVNEQFLDWHARQTRPYFALINYFDVHDIYEAPAPFNTMYRDPAPRYWLPRWGFAEAYSDADVAEMIDAYDSSVTYLDDRLGDLFAELDARGAFDNTIVILTSDHGEHLGEREMVLHGNSLYLPVIRVPLLVRFPDEAPEGVRVADPASIRDIPATVLELAGIEPGRLPGRSLSRFWNRDSVTHDAGSAGPAVDEPSDLSSPAALPATDEDLAYLYLRERDWHMPQDIIRYGTMKGAALGSMHYIVDGRGEEELYDVARDPHQQNNLAGRPEYAGHLDRFRAALDRMPEIPNG